MRKVPELSLLSFTQGTSTDRITFISKIMGGLKEYGFIVLNDHLVGQSTIKNAYDTMEQFFALSLDKKMSFICDEGAGQRGYTPFGTEHAKNHPTPDLKEFWHVGREVDNNHPFRPYYPPNLWADEFVPNFTKNMSKLYEELDQTSIALLDAIGEGLDLPKSYFREMLYLGNSVLRPLHYPPLAENMPKNAIRSAAHEDINLITILVGATTSGLELLDRDGKWLPVANKAGELIVDSGDMLSRITNNIVPATTHRVINPAEAENTSRYSMPFFVHPNPKTMLNCIPSCEGSGAKYPPINSHEFLLQRLKEIGLMK